MRGSNRDLALASCSHRTRCGDYRSVRALGLLVKDSMTDGIALTAAGKRSEADWRLLIVSVRAQAVAVLARDAARSATFVAADVEQNLPQCPERPKWKHVVRQGKAKLRHTNFHLVRHLRN